MQSANLVIPFYSSCGTTHKLAEAVEEGATDVPGSTVRLRRIPELPSAEEAMSGQDAYPLRQRGRAGEAVHRHPRWDVIRGRAGGKGHRRVRLDRFHSRGARDDDPHEPGAPPSPRHGVRGMVFVGVRHSTNDQIMTPEGVGGSPHGPSTMPREGSEVEAPTPEEGQTARSLGRRVTQVAARLQTPEDRPDEVTAPSA